MLNSFLRVPLIASWVVPKITLPIGFKPLETGLKISSLNHFAILELISAIDFLNGSVIWRLITPAIPPLLTPFLSLLPSIILLKDSVVEIKPKPAPRTAFPIRPNGPRNNVPNVAVVIWGNAFLIFSLRSLLINPPFSPNIIFWKVLLFFKNEIPEPIIRPPRGPNGKTNPASVPAIPYFFASGIYFWILAINFLENIPLSSLVLFPFSSTTSSPNI